MKHPRFMTNHFGNPFSLIIKLNLLIPSRCYIFFCIPLHNSAIFHFSGFFTSNLAIKRHLSLTHVKNWDPIGPERVVSVWQLQQI
ncbi:hypothetical protein L1987_72692 [Smallanthus sonchifolius]|uniref:Uncharacterized protein n=1 Tax=Smallanthus sonchifolius TaxID=185202 RepID=A0ACB9AW77_9ASTR|nr:hypothetical protein L1987_72692 [Smallanthus sonchifolius]